jgi:hypothetical protein
MATKRRKLPYKKRRTTRKMKGGVLVSSDSDLVNLQLCPGDFKPTFHYLAHRLLRVSGVGHRTGIQPSLGKEVYTATDTPMVVNSDTLGTFVRRFKESDDNWFKFVILNNDGINHIYVINGNEINKHSVPFLHGLLELTDQNEDGDPYEKIRGAYKAILSLKENGPKIEDSLIEYYPIVEFLNEAIKTHKDYNVRCASVVAAGSGTILDNKTICINNKSGHYAPSMKQMLIAKDIFEDITKYKINIESKARKNAIKSKYGSRSKNYSGMCITRGEAEPE